MRSVYGEAEAYGACMGTVSGNPRTQMKPASDGPAPPRRPSRCGEPSSQTRTPSDCSSTRSLRSSMLRVPLATICVELVVVAPEHALLELLRDVADPVQLPVLA